jgi:hypothetical protein
MSPFSGLFAYVGPDTFLPVTSALAAIAGVFMMFGRAGLRLIFGGGLMRILPGRRASGAYPSRHRRQGTATAAVAVVDTNDRAQ